MACDERWLFRMWHLHVFLVLVLFISQHGAAEVLNSPAASINNEKTPQNPIVDKNSQLAESQPTKTLTENKNETVPSRSNLLTDDAKPPPEGITKLAKETATNQTQAKVVNVQNAIPAGNSSVNETVKTSPTIANKQLIPDEKEPKIPPVTVSEKTEEKLAPPAKSVEVKLESDKKASVASNISDRKTSAEPAQEMISQTTLKKVPQASKEVDTQLPPDDFNDDFPNTPFTEQGAENYDTNDETDDDKILKNDDPVMDIPDKVAVEGAVTKDERKPQAYPKHSSVSDEFEDGDSHFFIYFLTVVGMCIVMYVLFHNKQKILALIVEGRQERRRRPNTSQYRPLDNNLEEVIQAGTPKNGRLTTNIIY